jgi:hypothetical protein
MVCVFVLWLVCIFFNNDSWYILFFLYLFWLLTMLNEEENSLLVNSFPPKYAHIPVPARVSFLD